MDNRIKTTAKATDVPRDLLRSLRSSFVREWYPTIIGFLSGTKSFYVLLIFGAIIVWISAVVGLDAMRVGYRHAYGVTREIPWGILISGYVFFVVTSTGLCIVSSI